MKKGLLVIGVLAFAVTVSGQGQGKGKGKGRGKGAKESGQGTVVNVVFTEHDRQVIETWAKGLSPSGLPPGLAKRGDLPPGLQKHLQRNGTLPPGLQKKVSPFPDDLIRRLGPLPPGCGCDRVFIDGRALIIARATSAILDVIKLF